MKHPGESNINMDAFVASDVDDSEHRIFTASISPGSTPARNTRGQTRGRLRTPPSPPKPRPRGRHAKPKLVEVPVSEQLPQRSPSPDPFLAPPGTTGLMSTPASSTSVHAPPSLVSASMPTTISSSSSPQDPPSVFASMDTGLLSTVSSSSVLAPPSSIAPSFASTLSSASSTHEPPSSIAPSFASTLSSASSTHEPPSSFASTTLPSSSFVPSIAAQATSSTSATPTQSTLVQPNGVAPAPLAAPSSASALGSIGARGLRLPSPPPSPSPVINFPAWFNRRAACQRLEFLLRSGSIHHLHRRYGQAGSGVQLQCKRRIVLDRHDG
ncbi:hypothetical protein CC2G_013926 [Coprinopsis cinerea AmutBmut pab1-1]|nr:hypothetical protein CC2G_013926 [Coprinopsis cinerea AmutBmut pab1-1]